MGARHQGPLGPTAWCRPLTRADDGPCSIAAPRAISPLISSSRSLLNLACSQLLRYAPVLSTTSPFPAVRGEHSDNAPTSGLHRRVRAPQCWQACSIERGERCVARSPRAEEPKGGTRASAGASGDRRFAWCCRASPRLCDTDSVSSLASSPTASEGRWARHMRHGATQSSIASEQRSLQCARRSTDRLQTTVDQAMVSNTNGDQRKDDNYPCRIAFFNRKTPGRPPYWRTRFSPLPDGGEPVPDALNMGDPLREPCHLISQN